MVALTVAEVAAFADVDESRVRKDIEYRVLDVAGAGGARLTFEAAVYLRALKMLGLRLDVDDRRRLFQTVSQALGRRRPPRRVPIGDAGELRLGDVAADVKRRVQRFEKWKARLVERDDVLGGEPVFPKSRLSVRKIGKLLIDGVAVAEIREDYPYLTAEDLELAVVFTRAYPRLGRPREAAAR